MLGESAPTCNDQLCNLTSADQWLMIADSLGTFNWEQLTLQVSHHQYYIRRSRLPRQSCQGGAQLAHVLEVDRKSPVTIRLFSMSSKVSNLKMSKNIWLPISPKEVSPICNGWKLTGTFLKKSQVVLGMFTRWPRAGDGDDSGTKIFKAKVQRFVDWYGPLVIIVDVCMTNPLTIIEPKSLILIIR